MLNPLKINELNNDQRREYVNTQQRFSAWREAKASLTAVRGSMVWHVSNGTEYLMRSYYEKAGTRKQRSLGPRSVETEILKHDFEANRDSAKQRFKQIDAAVTRQAGINRALAIGRVPLTSAKIIRALDDVGALGSGIRIIGTNAIYAYEAAAGVVVDSSLTTTGDIDLLFDSRGSLRFIVSEDISDRSLMSVLKSVDKSFERTRQLFRAQNDQGYMVDLIKPMRSHPWKADPAQLGNTADDIVASEIEGLVWLENAPIFEAIAIDERGFPLRIVAVDPRVFAVHKHWVSQRMDREPIKRRRDADQATVVGGLVSQYLTYLPFELAEMKMLPKSVAEAATHLFVTE